MPAPDIESVLSSRPLGFCTGMALAVETVVLAPGARRAPRFLADNTDVTSPARLNRTARMAASGGSALEPIGPDLHHRFQPRGFGHTNEAGTITENARFPLAPRWRQAQPLRISAVQ